MTLQPATPLAHIRDVHDLLGIIPHLLGFHPEESLVMLVITDAQVELTARADLADVRAPGRLEALLDRMLCTRPAASVWLVAYGSAEPESWRLLRRAAKKLGGQLAGEPICVCDGRYRVGDESGPVHPHDPASARTAATATWHGLQARPSRQALADLVRPDPAEAPAAEAACVQALDRLATVPPRGWPAAMSRALTAAVSAPDGIDRADLVRLGLLAQDPDSRDRALLAIDRASAEQWVEVWTRVVRACPYGVQQHPLALLGLAAWVSGNGALQSVCLEELQRQGARLPLQRLLEDINDFVTPPSMWDVLHPQLVAAAARERQPAATGGRRPRSRRRR